MKEKTKTVLVVLFLITVFTAAFLYFSGVTGSVWKEDLHEDYKGYCKFKIFDSNSGTFIDGEIILVDYNNTNELVRNSIKPNQIIKIDQEVLATVGNLESESERLWIPTSLVPKTAENKENSPENILIVYSLLNPNNVSITMSSSIYSSENYNITMNFLFANDNKIFYGASSYIPEYILPNININYEIYHSAVWAFFNNSKITNANAKVDGYNTQSYFIKEFNGTIVNLRSIVSQNYNLSLSLSYESKFSELYVFEGLLTHFHQTKKLILRG